MQEAKPGTYNYSNSSGMDLDGRIIAMPSLDYQTPLPMPENHAPRPLTTEEESRIDTLSRLQFFLATAPTRWQDNPGMITSRISKFQLPNGECISCVLWNGLYHVTGTDIVRALAFRFEAFGRPIHATKKWEEGVFSDLRNLKPGQDACLEDPKSPLLDFLFRNGCIRTQKKQKVFYWFSVPHDRLFLDALERDLKREKIDQEPTSIVVGEPARSFRYDPRRSLYDQFAGQNPGLNVLMRDMVSYNDTPAMRHDYPSVYNSGADSYALAAQERTSHPDAHAQMHMHMHMHESTPPPPRHSHAGAFGSASMEGSPNYKRRRTKAMDSPESGTPMSESARGPSVDVRDTESPGPEREGDSSFASDDSNLLPELRKHKRAKSRARSRLSSRAGSRAGSSDPRDGDSRNFLCPYDFCHRPFKRLEHLKRHVRTHTQERPYVCKRCTRNFSRQDNLAMHLKTHEKMDRDGGIMSDDDMRYSESPGPDVLYEPYSRASSGMPPPPVTYHRQSTLPPRSSSGPVYGSSSFQRSGTPSYGGLSQTLDVPGYGSPYDAGRRHRSLTPYAPTTSSNLAYTQPVIAPPVDMMGAYPTPITASEGDVKYEHDSADYTISQNNPTTGYAPMQHDQMQMQIPMEQQMQMSMQVPVEMQMPTQDYGGMHFDSPERRGGAPAGWGWRSYEPGALVVPEPGDAGGE